MSEAGSEDPPRSVRRVVVVDDHELLRTGTRRILDDTDGFEVVGEAADAERALALVDDLVPEVVLLDIRLPSINGIEVGRRIVADHPATTVILLTAYDDAHYVQAARAAGVAGYLLKTMPSDELLDAINRVCADPATFVGPSTAPVSSAGPDDGPRLTAREEDVVRLVAEGKTNKAIARELGISPRTVEGHLNHVFDRLGLQSRTELVNVAVSTGLLVRSSSDREDRAG